MADVAIEPDKGKKFDATPPGTLPFTPLDPVHMAIQDIAKLTDSAGGQDSKHKEYEVFSEN